MREITPTTNLITMWGSQLRAVRFRRERGAAPSGKARSGGEKRRARGRRRSYVVGSVYLLVLLFGAGSLTVFSVMRNSAAPVGPAPTLVAASLPFWNLGGGTDSVIANRNSVNEVSPWMYGINAQSEIATQFPPEQAPDVQRHIATLRQSGLPIVPTLANITNGVWAYEPVARVLHDPAMRQKHIDEIVALVKRENFAGIDIDYENLRGGDRAAFSKFVTDLGNVLHREGKTLGVAVFAKINDAGYDERNVAQDYAAIGRAADEVRIMAYDYHWGTSPPGPVAPIGWVRDVLNYAKTEIPPGRIVLGVPLYGYDWSGGQGAPVTWLQAFRLSTEHKATVQYDAASQTPWFTYTDQDGRRHDVWFENAVSSKAKFEAARGSGVRGVYLWMYGYEDTETWPGLQKSLPVGG
jgi:spore germination protein YaaH